jgi:hypothetical protein
MENPYATNVTNPVASSDSHGSAAITPAIIQALAGTKPWVRFCSVLGFIGCGLMGLGGLAMLGVGLFAGTTGEGGPVMGAPMIGIAAFYFVLGALYLFPSIKLWKYGTHIFNLMHSESVMDLEAALEAQRSFWKFVGIMICIMIGLYIVFFGLVMVGSIFMSGSIPSP